MNKDEHFSAEKEEQQLAELLRSGLDTLDRTVSITEPESAAFAARLEEQRRMLRKRFVRDLLLFLAAACSLLGVMGLMLFKVPMLFMVLYGAGFLLPAILAYKEKEKGRVREG
jgi:hypothetical protein